MKLTPEDEKEIARLLTEELGIPVEFKHIECPHRRPPMIAIDPQADKIYEGAAMCSETDKFCLLDEGLECDAYNEFLNEEAELNSL